RDVGHAVAGHRPAARAKRAASLKTSTIFSSNAGRSPGLRLLTRTFATPPGRTSPSNSSTVASCVAIVARNVSARSPAQQCADALGGSTAPGHDAHAGTRAERGAHHHVGD